MRGRKTPSSHNGVFRSRIRDHRLRSIQSILAIVNSPFYTPWGRFCVACMTGKKVHGVCGHLCGKFLAVPCVSRAQYLVKPNSPTLIPNALTRMSTRRNYPLLSLGHAMPTVQRTPHLTMRESHTVSRTNSWQPHRPHPPRPPYRARVAHRTA